MEQRWWSGATFRFWIAVLGGALTCGLVSAEEISLSCTLSSWKIASGSDVSADEEDKVIELKMDFEGKICAGYIGAPNCSVSSDSAEWETKFFKRPHEHKLNRLSGVYTIKSISKDGETVLSRRVYNCRKQSRAF